MSRMLSYYKSQLKHAAKSGPQFVTITDARLFFDSNGKMIKKGENSGLVVTFKNDNIEHQELYWFNTGKLHKFDEILGVKNDDPQKDEYQDRKLWIVIRHNITIDNNQNEIKREAEIVHYSVDEKVPEYPQIYEEYDIAAV